MKTACYLFCGLMVMALTSCVSVRQYSKVNTHLIQDGVVETEQYSHKRDKKITLESSEKVFKATEVQGRPYYVKIEKSSKGNETVKIKADSEESLERSFKVDSKKGFVEFGSSNKVKGEELAKFEQAYRNVSPGFSGGGQMKSSSSTSAAPVSQAKKVEADNGSIVLRTQDEEVTVESVPNKSYIAYSIIGKPFVILGSTAWNLLKSVGYAAINFAGGYSTVTGGKTFWMMPDYKKAKAKADENRAANQIKAYPEYHLPFTNNHITVHKISSETTNEFSNGGEDVKVLSEEKLSFDNSISVGRSVTADAAATASVVGLVGTVITIPVSVVTWIGGAAAGIYVNMK